MLIEWKKYLKAFFSFFYVAPKERGELFWHEQYIAKALIKTDCKCQWGIESYRLSK